MPANYPLDLYRGDTYYWQFRFWQDAAKTVASDLTGVAVASQIRGVNDALLVTLTCVVTLPNIVDVTLPAEESKKLSTKAQLWDLELTYADGSVWTPAAGAVKVSTDATQ